MGRRKGRGGNEDAPTRSITPVTEGEIQNIAPIPTQAVTDALNPSLSSLVNESPTIPASDPRREITSPVERTPVGFAAMTAVEVTLAGALGEGVVSAFPCCFVAEPWRSCQPMSCRVTYRSVRRAEMKGEGKEGRTCRSTFV